MIEYVAGLDGVDPNHLGVLTSSYGITLGAGAVGRYPDLPVAWLVDMEGPSDSLTVACYYCDEERGMGGHLSTATDPSPENVAWWSEREAYRFIGNFRGEYLRVQAWNDHVQPEGLHLHALQMNEAAITGGVPWVRINGSDMGNPVNELYEGSEPAWLPGRMADYRDLDVSYIIEMARRSGATIDPWWNVDLELPYDADRLPNGNTLIADSMHDRVIEVDPAGEIVWRYPPLAAPDRSSPFGLHPASVFVPGYPDNGFVDAETIGVRWHRPPVYAFWFLVQPDLSRDELDFSLLDRQYGEVPAGISTLANIAPENPVQPEGRTVAGTYLPVDEAAYRAFVRATTVVPSASVGADVDDPEHAFPLSILPVAEGRVSIPVPEDPIVVEELEDTPPRHPSGRAAPSP